eukprot:15458646-Alexandrium_andersonii.AAC.1
MSAKLRQWAPVIVAQRPADRSSLEAMLRSLDSWELSVAVASGELATRDAGNRMIHSSCTVLACL